MEETVSRREVKVVNTDFKSSSKVVAGPAAASAATGAAATGTAVGAATTGAATTGAAEAETVEAGVTLRPAFLASVAAGAATAAARTGAAATGAGAGATTSSVFFATRLVLEAEEAEELIVILVPVEEFILTKRTIPTYKARSESIFIQFPSISMPGLTRGTFFFERPTGYDGFETCV